MQGHDTAQEVDVVWFERSLAWVFDVYLNERLSGGSATVARTRVVNAIQSSPEWQSKH